MRRRESWNRWIVRAWGMALVGGLFLAGSADAQAARRGGPPGAAAHRSSGPDLLDRIEHELARRLGVASHARYRHGGSHLVWRHGRGLRARRGHRGARGVPAFCRSGAGHPVFGRAWCHERGFHDRSGRHGSRVIVLNLGRSGRHAGRGHRDPYLHGRYGHGVRLGPDALVDILGHAALDHLLYDILGLGSGRRITGRLHDARDGRRGYRGTAYWDAGYRGPGYADAVALQLFDGSRRLAELTDFDRDGWVDLLMVRDR